MEKFVARPTAEVDESAAHFGVSADNLVASYPAAGTVGFEIGQAGCLIVGYGRYQKQKLEISPRHLFKDVYTPSIPGISIENAEEQGYTKEFIIPDDVVEFAKQRNVAPLVVIRLGSHLLSYAARMNAGPNVDLEVHLPKKNGRAGKLDSRLKFAISAMNTVLVSRQKAGFFR